MIRTLQSAGPLLKIILAGILLVICAGMVITLIPGGIASSFGIGGPGKGIVATVGDQEVTVPDVQRLAKMMLQRQFPQGGEQTSALLPFFTGQAAEQLISQKALIVEAHRLGLRVTDQELGDDLQNGALGATLFPEGKFIGQEQYDNLVQRNFNATIPQFEQLVKDDILVRKLRALIAGGATVGDAEVRAEFDRRNTKVKFDYAVLSQADILKGLHPTDQELKAFYDRNKAGYVSPEKRQIRYALVEAAKPAEVTPTPQELQSYYNQHSEQYRVPEQVKVGHIQFNVPLPGPGGKVDEKGVEETRKKAEDVLKRVKAGEDFGKLAEQYSNDATSAKKGGEIGWIRRGQADAAFDKVAFSLPKGQTSDLVKTSSAFHILRVLDKQEAHVKLLAEVKSEIEDAVRQQKATRATEAAANSLLSQSRTEGLDKAAAAKGIQVVMTGLFSRTDTLPGISPTPELMEAIFNEREKSPPDMVQIPGGFVVLELLATKLPSTLTFEEARSTVETQFKSERAGQFLQQKTQELSDRAKAGHDLKKAAKELGATVKTSEFVLPDGQVPDVGSMAGSANIIFALNPGEISAPINTGANGIVAQLREKQMPTDQEYAAKKGQIRQGLLDGKEGELFSLFISNLRKDMEKSKKVQINQDELKNLTRRGEEGS